MIGPFGASIIDFPMSKGRGPPYSIDVGFDRLQQCGRRVVTSIIQDRHDILRSSFEAVGQGHVLAFWSSLSEGDREALLGDLERVSVRQIPGLVELLSASQHDGIDNTKIESAVVVPRDAVTSDIADRGRALLSAGKVAAFTVAGGQGTRLGFDGPKGAFEISPVRGKPMFQLFAESIRASEVRYDTAIPWYVMTSPANDAETRAFFEARSFFGLDSDRVRFFQQGVMPAFDVDGKMMLDQKHRVALSPDGHGGSLLAMATTGTLADMAERGIEIISYFQVDNPLVSVLDPAFIGLHDERGSEMSSKALPKADDLERVGNFVMTDGRMKVIEYSDFPDDLAHARSTDGSRRFDAANIAIHLLSRSFVERLTVDPAAFALPWHLAHKKVPHVDLASGQRIEPDAPNATKFEAFVFDALPLARNPIILETSRSEEFSPVKNPTGVDSVESAQRDMIRRTGRWLAAAGVNVPRDGGECVYACEVSPLVALDAEQLKEHVRDGTLPPCAVAPSGEALYWSEESMAHD